MYIYSREWLTGLFMRPCASLGFKAPCQGSHLPERHFHQKACSTKSPQSRRSQLCAADELVVWKAFIQEPAICSVSSLLITLKKYFRLRFLATASANWVTLTEMVTVRGQDRHFRHIKYAYNSPFWNKAFPGRPLPYGSLRIDRRSCAAWRWKQRLVVTLAAAYCSEQVQWRTNKKTLSPALHTPYKMFLLHREITWAYYWDYWENL